MFKYTGGLADEATIFYKCLASLLSIEWGDSYSVTLGWLSCHLSLLHSAITCMMAVSMVLDHHLVTLTELHLQWIWLDWNHA